MGKDTVQSVAKVFSIIEVLAENDSIGVREISSITGINKTSVFRMLTTLVELGYAAQVEESAKYFLTYKLLVVGNAVLTKNHVVKLIHPYLQKISEDCKETVHLIERVGTNVRYIDKILPTSGVVAMGSYIGMELPLTCTAVGKAILAELPAEEIEEIWKNEELIKYTSNTIENLDVLIENMEFTRNHGYAVDNEEREMGIFCAAVSIPNYKGEPVYAMSVSAPVNKMSGENLEKICNILLEEKKNIIKIIGKA